MINSCQKLILIVIALFLSGCKGSEPYQDLQEYFKKVADGQAPYDRELNGLDIKPSEPVVYSGNLRRSPFEEVGKVTAAGQVAAVPANPLQAYSLNMLRLLGTVTEKGETFAYLSAPDNMIYRVQVGDMIGDHHGKVISIQPGLVNVMELDTDNQNESVQRVVALKLRNEP